MYLMSPIRGLCRQADSYLESDQVKEIYRAYEFGAKAHAGQQRLSGEPYIHHPVRVAHILAEMHMDPESIVGRDPARCHRGHTHRQRAHRQRIW